MLQLVVDVFPRLAGLEVVEEQSLGRGIEVGEFLELAFHVGDPGPVGAPARLAAVVGDLGAARAVAVHVVDVADLGIPLPDVGDEADLGAVG